MATSGPPPAEHWYVRQLCRLFAASTAALIGFLAWQWYRDDAARKTARDEVNKLITDQETAWNAGNLDGFMDGYRMTDDITFYSEDKVEFGWIGLRERYERRYRAGGKSMGFLTFEDLTIDVLSADAVVTRGKWRVVQEGKTSSGLFTILLRKLPEGWRIVHDHTSAPCPKSP